jgi:hypothetical protein
MQQWLHRQCDLCVRQWHLEGYFWFLRRGRYGLATEPFRRSKGFVTVCRMEAELQGFLHKQESLISMFQLSFYVLPLLRLPLSLQLP